MCIEKKKPDDVHILLNIVRVGRRVQNENQQKKKTTNWTEIGQKSKWSRCSRFHTAIDKVTANRRLNSTGAWFLFKIKECPKSLSLTFIFFWHRAILFLWEHLITSFLLVLNHYNFFCCCPSMILYISYDRRKKITVVREVKFPGETRGHRDSALNRRK